MTGNNAEPEASDTRQITVRDAVYDLMRRFGMTSVFGNPGSTELPMFRDFPSDFRYILGLQEASVVGMADGYAQATRNAALVNLHSAAGVGNAMGNIFTAYTNRTPLVITAGQQARSILPFKPFLGSTQATELPKPFVKWSVEPSRAQDVPLAIAHAYYTSMMSPCGPVLVSVPVDDWDQRAELVVERSVSRCVAPDPAYLAEIGTLLDVAKRPCLVIGAAADRDGAWDGMVALAERHGASVWTAPMCGRSTFPETHRLFAGFLPAIREQIVNLLQGHDVILALGAPAFTYHVEGAGPHVPIGAKLCQIVDQPDTAVWTPVGIAAVGSIRLGVAALLTRPAVAVRPLPPARPAVPRAEPTAPMSVAFVLQTLAEARTGDEVIVEEAPSARSVMQAYLPIEHSEGFYTMDSGGLGYGMPASVGIALGRPEKQVLCIMGDGSSMYSIQALWNAVQGKLPITYLILNNGRYAALQDFARAFGFTGAEVVQGTDLPGIDFVSLAKGMGCPGERIQDHHVLKEKLVAALGSEGPYLLDISVA